MPFKVFHSETISRDTSDVSSVFVWVCGCQHPVRLALKVGEREGRQGASRRCSGVLPVKGQREGRRLGWEEPPTAAQPLGRSGQAGGESAGQSCPGEELHVSQKGPMPPNMLSPWLKQTLGSLTLV